MNWSHNPTKIWQWNRKLVSRLYTMFVVQVSNPFQSRPIPKEKPLKTVALNIVKVPPSPLRYQGRGRDKSGYDVGTPLPNFGVSFIFWKRGSMSVGLENDDHAYGDAYGQKKRNREGKNGDVSNSPFMRAFIPVVY
jgi:hypothetical protein